MTKDEIIKAAATLRAPRAIEAYWDGDTQGWFVILAAVGEREFASIRFGGDLRLFNGAVPPWPEAVLAKEVGEEIAARFGVPFWFPATNQPEDDAAKYDERAHAVPCSACGLPLVQNDTCPWKGACYPCHLASERRMKSE